MLKVGTVLMLEPVDTKEQEKYKCKVVDMDESHVYIDYPIDLETERTVFLLNGARFNASFVHEETVAYLFETSVAGKVKKNIPMIILVYPGEDKLLRIQRREFVRVGSSLDIALEFPNSGEHFTTVTEDISAGGCAAILPEGQDIPAGEIGKAHIVLPMQSGQPQYVSLICKAVRVHENYKKNVLSLQFLNVDDGQQQTLIRHCFERQLALRKKGIDHV